MRDEIKARVIATIVGSLLLVGTLLMLYNL